MAQPTVTISVKRHYKDANDQIVFGTITIGAGDYSSGAGPALDFSGTNGALIKSSKVPTNVEITGNGKYNYSYIPGTTRDNGTIRAWTGGTEATSTIPSDVQNDTIRFVARFPILR